MLSSELLTVAAGDGIVVSELSTDVAEPRAGVDPDNDVNLDDDPDNDRDDDNLE